MQQYYTIMETPGVKFAVEPRPLNQSFSWLDNDELVEKLIEFKQDNTYRATLYIPTIHCSSCIWLLENLERLDDGISRSIVNFVKKEVTITWDNSKTTLRQIVRLLADLHYEPEITLEDMERGRSRKVNRRIIYQIGVAGFAFSNIMLLSLPDYLAHKEGLELTFRDFFGWINLLLVLPVVVFSARDYYESAFSNLRKGILNLDVPIVIGIITLFCQSLYEVVTAAGSGYFDSLAGFVFFLLIGRWYQGRTYQALSFERNYKSYFPVAVTRLREGKEESLMLQDIKKGDLLLIHNQELIPSDGILIDGEAIINYAFVTGESLPVRKQAGEAVYAGGRQTGGGITIEIEEEVEQSKLTRLWNQETDNRPKHRIMRLVDIVSRRFTIGLLIMASLTLLGWLWFDPGRALIAFVSVLIVACPCALALTVPFAYGTTMQIMGRRGLYLRESGVVENLSNVDVVVFDKTGTLTLTDDRQVDWQGRPLTDVERQLIRSLCRSSVHPLSQAVAGYLTDSTALPVINFRELSARGILGNINGVEVRAGSSAWLEVPVDESVNVNVSAVHIVFDGQYRGFFSIGNSYRKGLEPMLPHLRRVGPIHVISGDNDAERGALMQLMGSEAFFSFDMSPADKLEYIRHLRNKGLKPLMIGDGLNDAG
ncbi:MAG: heavy metal translocating P-type ATPase, partial [Bacteroidetes bacterium HGW-Bacteroidetes-22]